MPEPLLQVLIFELNLWKKMQKTGMPRLSTPFIGTGQRQGADYVNLHYATVSRLANRS